jgi:hypothetical protein
VDLIYGAAKLDRCVEAVEDLLREWRVREADWGQLYLEFEPATPLDVLLVEDLAVTMLINSRVAGQAAAAVLRNGGSLDLGAFPDKPLEETTADERRRLAVLTPPKAATHSSKSPLTSLWIVRSAPTATARPPSRSTARLTSAGCFSSLL